MQEKNSKKNLLVFAFERTWQNNTTGKLHRVVKRTRIRRHNWTCNL